MAKTSFAIHGDICHSKGPNELECVKDGYVVCEEGRSAGGVQLAAGAILRNIGAGIPGYARAAGIGGPACTRGAVRLPRHGYGCGAFGLVGALCVSGGGALCGFGLCRARLQPFRGGYAPRTEYESLRFCLGSHRGYLAAYGPFGRVRTCDHGRQESAWTKTHRTTCANRMPPPPPRRPYAGSMPVAGRHYVATEPALTPRFIPSCSHELLRALGEIRRQCGTAVQSHLSENRAEVELVRELCPDSRFYGEAYDSFGLFGGEGGKTVRAHCVLSARRSLS